MRILYGGSMITVDINFCVILSKQVSRIISHFKLKKGEIYTVQVPQVVSTLTKKVFFMPWFEDQVSDALTTVYIEFLLKTVNCWYQWKLDYVKWQSCEGFSIYIALLWRCPIPSPILWVAYYTKNNLHWWLQLQMAHKYLVTATIH